MKERTEKICLATVKGMGFTEKLVRDFLPEPELVPNPNYRRAAPMKLWKRQDVEEAMEKKECKEALADAIAKRQKRSAAAKKAVKTKTDQLMEQVKEQITKIHVERVDMWQLKEDTLLSKQEWYDDVSYMRDREAASAYGADEETVERWMVNYIRHNLTRYDAKLFQLTEETRGKTGKHQAYFAFFKAIMSGIKEIYPELEEECDRQVWHKKFECEQIQYAC